MPDLAYLASCYSHIDPVVREERYLLNLHAAAYLMRRGEVVFSPITHGHSIAKLHELPEEWSFWKHHDETFLTRCQKLYVLVLDGVENSVGVAEEIGLARDMRLPIVLMIRDGQDYKFEEFRTFRKGRGSSVKVPQSSESHGERNE